MRSVLAGWLLLLSATVAADSTPPTVAPAASASWSIEIRGERGEQSKDSSSTSFSAIYKEGKVAYTERTDGPREVRPTDARRSIDAAEAARLRALVVDGKLLEVKSYDMGPGPVPSHYFQCSVSVTVGARRNAFKLSTFNSARDKRDDYQNLPSYRGLAPVLAELRRLAMGQ